MRHNAEIVQQSHAAARKALRRRNAPGQRQLNDQIGPAGARGAGADVLRCGADGKIRMDGFGVFRFVAGPVAAFLKGFHAANPAIDLFVPHQANLYMVRQLAKTLGLAGRLLTSGERYANPGSCSVALTLAAHGEAAGRALLAGFGAGLAASAACVAIPQTCRRGVVET